MSRGSTLITTATLERRPEAATFSIEGLVTDVLDGRIRIPTWQRPINWAGEDIELLLDSIYRGYPIGTLLFWKRPADAESIRVGPVKIEASSRQDALWVVDGQQRITALTGVLASSYDALTELYSLFYDLESDTFVRAKKRQPPAPTWLPLNQVLDSEKLLLWLHQTKHELTDAYTAKAIRLGKRVREYQVPAYVVESSAEEPLRAIFERTNSTGKALKKQDIFDALHSRADKAPSSMREIAEALAGLEFGHIDEKFVLQALLAIADKDISRDFRSQLGDSDVTSLLGKTQSALEQAIRFLQNQASIPHIAFLPYRSLLVALAKLFNRYPNPDKRSQMLLARWIWRGSITHRHQGSITASRKMLRAIEGEEQSAVRRLLAEAGGRPTVPLSLGPYNFRHADSKILAMALWAQAPRDLSTGELLSLPVLRTHSPPTQRILSSAVASSELGDSLSNVILHPPLASIRKHLRNTSDDRVLRSHGISRIAWEHLRSGDNEAFLQERARDLRRLVDAWLEARAEWDASDRPSLSSLVVADE